MLPSQSRSAKNWVLNAEIAELVRRKARQLSKLRGFSLSDRPDIEQELMLELVKRASRYDSGRAKQTTFASRIIENKAASLVRTARAQKRTCHREAVSLNDTVHDDEGNQSEISQTIEESAGRRHTGQRVPSQASTAQLRIDVADANRQLPWELRRIAALLSHVPEFAAAEVLGISRRRASQHVATLRKLYQERGLAS